MGITTKKNNSDAWVAHMKRKKNNVVVKDGNFGKEIAALVGSGKNVLDIGCGAGKCLYPLAENGNKVFGIDIASAPIEECRRNGFEAMVKDIEDDDIEDLMRRRPFDAVIMADVLEHLIDPVIVLRDKVLPLLGDGGVCIATIPNFVFYRYRTEIMLGNISHFNNDDKTHYDPPRPYNLGHKTMFNLKNIKETFRLAGFSSVRIEPELFSESLSGFWRVPFLNFLRLSAKKLWPTMMAARYLVIAEK